MVGTPDECRDRPSIPRRSPSKPTYRGATPYGSPNRITAHRNQGPLDYSSIWTIAVDQSENANFGLNVPDTDSIGQKTKQTSPCQA